MLDTVLLIHLLEQNAWDYLSGYDARHIVCPRGHSVDTLYLGVPAFGLSRVSLFLVESDRTAYAIVADVTGM